MIKCVRKTQVSGRREAEAAGSSGVLQTAEHEAHSRRTPGTGGGGVDSKGQGPQQGME